MKQNRREFIILSVAGAASLAVPRLGFASAEEANALLKKADEQIMQADDKKKVLELIGTYQSVLDIGPQNYEALWSLGRYCGLIGIAYADDIDEKRKYYSMAVDYSERGLRTNPEFEAMIKSGRSTWDACCASTKREMAALFYWWSGNAALWKECSGTVKQIVGMGTLSRSKKIMARMMEIDPLWGGGHPYFAWAVYYSVMPRILGGDLEKAKWYFDKNLEAGSNWIYVKHGRAVFYQTRVKNRQGFIDDLQWVIAQDPQKADSPYPANVYFQRTAKEMLANIDDYF